MSPASRGCAFSPSLASRWRAAPRDRRLLVHGSAAFSGAYRAAIAILFVAAALFFLGLIFRRDYRP